MKINIPKIRKITKRVGITLGVMCLMSWGGVGGYQVAKRTILPVTVFAEKTVEVPGSITFPPMLAKICNAESGSKQFNDKGMVLRGKVNPSDIGFCQINEPKWNDQARKLGYDIFTEQGNKDMALWIFLNYGDGPWYLSKANWSK